MLAIISILLRRLYVMDYVSKKTEDRTIQMKMEGSLNYNMVFLVLGIIVLQKRGYKRVAIETDSACCVSF